MTSKAPTVSELLSIAPGMKPEWIAPGILSCKGEQGADGPADCVTVWFVRKNWNCSTSPGFACTSLGVKIREVLTLLEPTAMGMSVCGLGASVYKVSNQAVTSSNTIMAELLTPR